MRNRLTDELAVCGVNAVLALGEFHPERVNRLFLREELLPKFTKLCKNLADRKHPYKICLDDEIERISKSTHHQGIAAMIDVPEITGATEEDLETWTKSNAALVLLYDVGNDHNLGAIVRSAAFFDAPWIILTEKDEEARITTSTYRVAEGGMEHVSFRKVRDPAAFLRAASKTMTVIGTDPRARLRIGDLPKLLEGKTGGVILVLGNEERGLPKNIKDNCSCLARIPGTGNVESLNVAQAATLFLRELYER